MGHLCHTFNQNWKEINSVLIKLKGGWKCSFSCDIECKTDYTCSMYMSIYPERSRLFTMMLWAGLWAELIINVVKRVHLDGADLICACLAL